MRIVMRNEGGGFAEILRLRSQLFWHSLSHIRRFSPLRMTKRGDARRYAESRFPVSSFPNIDRWAANDKDFSLALEMTTRESPMSPSLLVL